MAGFFLPIESESGPATKNPMAAPSITADSEYWMNASGTWKKAAMLGKAGKNISVTKV
jgi:hypothetical protein